ncbi:MAG: hypothetical protein JXB14_03025 [Candidatus Altiarchaeota archaeon]|nr:hypothetical protein [Candidatus Altiarchaeota archaeon]
MPPQARISRGLSLGDGYHYLNGAVVGDNVYHTIMDNKRTERLIIISPIHEEKSAFVLLTDFSSPTVVESLARILGLVKDRQEGKNMFIYKMGRGKK